MTIHEHDRVSTGDGSRKGDPHSAHALVDRLNAGEPYAVAFGGQGSAWLETLEELVTSAGIESELATLAGEADLLLEPVAKELVVVRPIGFEPLRWIRALAAEEPVPSAKQLTSAAVSVPGVLLTQIAAVRALARQGMDLTATPPVAVAGHSQGVLAVEALKAQGAQDVQLLAMAQLIGAAGTLVARRRGISVLGDRPPMVSVTNADPERIYELLDEFSKDVRTVLPPVLSIRNGRRSVVITGTPEQLSRFELYCEQIAETEAAERKSKLRGGAVFSPVFDPVAVEVGFHTPRLSDGIDMVGRWAEAVGLDVALAREMTEAILVRQVDWVEEITELYEAGARWILDLGPGDILTRLTAPVIRGLGIGIVPAATRGGQRNLFTVGAVPEVARPWSSYAPSVVTLPDGSVKLSTKFTRLTGRSPILLAGMTPTTVDAKIVAAATNAGHWAELAGGGQVTEAIFDRRIGEVTTLLEPGRAIQFNSLFLDPYLWKLQLGGKRLVQKARQSGAPIDGVVVSAGIPDLEEAVELIDELNGVGISHICFKPGTVEQIRSVIRIAAEVPTKPVIMHIEGGRAGGHHSWEDLDDLLLATYSELRARSNITVCVGGGIGTPERSAEYLSGQWSQTYGYPLMPIDGILVGTAAMAALESTTSPAVKQLLVETGGTDQWVGAGKAENGMASGRSQLGADIHEIDNTASRCGRLLDEVAGDAEAVAARRDEIIAAMADTAKPYFGDVADMTYLQWLRRYVELAIGDGDSTADTASADSPWLDITWRDRFAEMLQRAEARLHPQDYGPIETLFAATDEGEQLLENPGAAIASLLERYPDAETVGLHPADVPFFVTLCKTLGKPVNFVPVIDKDVRRWWRSDSLWQAHDARYTADQVCIIPGTAAVAGITRVDEPVGDLLDRFEKAAVDQVLAAGAEPQPVASRRLGRTDVTGPLAIVLDAPDVLWAGRTAINPVHRIADPADWQVHENRSAGWSEATGGSTTAGHPSTGARLEVDADQVVLSVPLSGTWIDIRFTLPETVTDGGAPVVSTEDAATAMRAVLAIAAGVDGPEALPPVHDGAATVTVAWDPEQVADHTGVTATFGAPLAPGLTPVPDSLVGRCWPAVFAAIGEAATDSGFPVVEGLLSLVHLDHAAHLLTELPKQAAELTVTATASVATDTEVGRVVPVSVTVTDTDGTLLARLEERFAIRGRTGAAELADPVRAGGAVSDNATDTPRRRRRDVSISAPIDMRPFAMVSGDHNPIHTDRAAALLAGLESPIVHGMWLSAAGQHVATAADGKARPPARLIGWTARFLGMVKPGDDVDFRVDRVGIDQGAEVLEVSARVRRGGSEATGGSSSGSDLVMSATARLTAPKTVYAFPGQGIQHKGMGMEVRARSKAARKVWDNADKFTRDTLGFSVLHVVRDNPTSLIASGVHYQHPEGVLYLTQFTQVAMATVAAAQVAEMRESGAFVEGAIACGHSVGEYTALACVSGVYALEALLEVVFHRGSKMHDIVPRDELGRSNYRLAAIRPSQIDLPDADVTGFVAEIAERTGEFLQIVNFNLRGSQYAIAGTVRGLEALEETVEQRRELTGGKRSFILVPGVDVPFHSSVLRVGVADFRRSLERVMPRDADPALLVGRYIPNLVPRPFTLDRDFVQEVRDLVPAEPLDEILADYDTWRAEKPHELCRKLVIELLAWQFASPVRWIETQDLLFIEEDAGGLGVERFVEIGVKSAPTVAGLATNTLKLPEYAHSTVEVLNSERDAAVLFATDTDPEPEPDLEDSEPASEAAPAAPTAPSGALTSNVAGSAAPRPDDIGFDAADATLALIALSAKMRIDQIEALDSIESITDGASSRRNQLLVDLGSELNLGAIDGAAEADLAGLKAQVTKLARTYKPFGPVLSDAINDQLRTVLGPSGKRPAAIAERVKKTWELGHGWAKHATVELALGTREGTSVRGGGLGGLHEGALADAAAVDKAIDAAVAAVAARKGIAVSLPSTGGGGGGTVDLAALGEFTEQITGRDGVLASAARLVLGQLGLDNVATTPPSATDAELIELVTAELGADWPRLVAPVFDAKKAVLFDDRWASAREDLVKLWLADEGDIDADWSQLSERFEGAGHVVATQANWWQGKSLAVSRNVHASLFGRIAAGAENPGKGRYSDEVAVVTGASKGSIAASVVGQLLDGGATVIATTSKLDEDRLAFYRTLYRDHARYGAALWVVPANMASYADIDALVSWVGSEQTESLGPQSIHIKDAQNPTLLFPFAAPRVAGDLSEAGARSEMEMKVLLWAVQRLIGGLSGIGSERDIASRLHVVLPGSPNRGMFGGDGAYGESKSALDAVVTRWNAETSWAARVSLAHALIGWTKGTGLMGHNDAIVSAVEEAGVTTYTTQEMAAMLLDLCTVESKVAAASAPIKVDLTGGLGDVELDLAGMAAKAREDHAANTADNEAQDGLSDAEAGTIAALPSPPRGYNPAPPPVWHELDVDPADLVVIVGGAELGPYGSSRTRFEMEVDNELSAAGVLELAWTTGLIKWEDDPMPGWYDVETGDLVPESELVERYHDIVVERTGIREFVGDGAIEVDHSSPLLVSVFLDKDFSFVVSSEAEARGFVEFDPEHTVATRVPDSTDWQVVRKAGTEIRVPRKTKMSRTVGAQIPTGFDPTVWGITPDMANSIDRVALWNIVATVDAFLSAGFSPTELMRWVHPSLVASTQGTGMGGLTSMQTMFHGNLLGQNKPNDILQESLPNVVAAHVIQAYVGSYGSMIHPVGACATAAVSLEEGVDKIRLGKAELVVTGGYDDLTLEAVTGFGDMAATADTETMRAKGISDSKFSRANDRRRMGFVEAQGGGTILLARGDLAVRMGLPVLAVVAYAQSFGDGVHTSIPAPGLGALGAGRGGKDSVLARSLAKLGVGPDDVAVISKHDTSTLANDPNEQELHERLADSMGRSDGAPLFVVSQKSLTGHAKGGAAVFQMMGLCQILRDGVIPPNRSLDCVDDELATSGHFVWPRETLRLGDRYPLKAGLVTSLGFGHVSGLVALVHPQAFLATLDADQREAYAEQAQARVLAGQRRLASAIAGGRPMYERPADRRFDHDLSEKRQEAAMLLNPGSRLGDGDVYVQ